MVLGLMASQTETQSELSAVRDAVESIGVAIVLAFVLRAFMVEAFVIPTGSMAPRLMGEHVLLSCQACRYEFAYGRSKNVGAPQCHACGYPLVRCPSCNFENACSLNVDKTDARCMECGRPKGALGRVLSGDRVLVLKYLYRFIEPKPWDVVVFKNPQDNAQNYIKRLIGLPGETIEIVHGDIFVGKSDKGPWRIRRKPPRAQKAMWQIVFDNDYRPDESLRENHPTWHPPVWKRVRDDQTGWEAVKDDTHHGYVLNTRVFQFKGVPKQQEIEFRTTDSDYMPNYGYNAPIGPVSNGGLDSDAGTLQAHICTDLKLSFTFEPHAEGTVVALMLSSFEHVFKGEVHGDGTVRLYHRLEGDKDTDWQEWGRAKADGITVGKACEVALTHADFRVTLWVDGKDVLHTSSRHDPDPDPGRTYDPDHDQLVARMKRVEGIRGSRPEPIPIPQVRIGASGGPCTLRHVRVMRDVFYTSMTVQTSGAEYISPLGDYARERQSTKDLDLTGQGWGVMGNPITLVRNPDNPDLDEFFVLGDNSPQSLDSRAWATASPSLRLYADKDKTLPQYKLGTVPRYNMIGKAFFVYWPAGFALPGLPELPIVPNVGRMRLIR